jgi:prolyl-tRNA synthetase
MKDAYSFDVDWEGLNSSFEDQRGAYMRIYDRCGLEYVVVDADSGAMGGKNSNEFMVYTDAGEDLVASCARCGYAANTEKAISRLEKIDDGQTASELERFPTPGIRTIQDLITFDGGAPADRQIKTLVYTVTGKRGTEEMSLPILALVRGDHSINDVKLAHALTRMLAADKWQLEELRAATEDEIVRAMGAHAGSLGAVGVKGQKVIADEALRGRKNMTTGANEDDVHVRGVSLERDIAVSAWEDIRQVVEGEGCPRCDGTLRVAKALEVGHIFKLGTKYSESMGARVLTAEGKEVPIIMGCYGIGVERILAAAVELHNDEAGIIFPVSIAPFQLVVTPLNVKDGQLLETAERIFREAMAAGIETVLDDRDERAGVKLNDADLVGFPFRITIGPKKLKDGHVELYDRSKREAEDVLVGEAVKVARDRINSALLKLNKKKHD